LIDDLLDVSRIITGKLRLEIQALNLTSIIEAAIDSVRPAAAAKSISFVTEVDGEIAEIHGDANRLQQIFWNLFSNAVKFTPERGCVTVSLGRQENQISIIVSDTGQGIAPEFLPFIFDRFRQADGSTTRKHGGLGLGLAIVRHLVELHGGTIQADSLGAGKGAAFTVTLPTASIQSSTVKDSQPPRSVNSHGAANHNFALEGVRVFVVDDENDTRDLISVILRQHGADVHSYATASEVFQAIEEATPDLLVSDIGMPHEDGYALIKRLRQHQNPEISMLPALALTAYASLDDKAKTIRAGFDQHIAKPVYPDKLIEGVKRLAKKDALVTNLAGS
jgi:CheY-like chemotaxis protein/two-component sensor histidine kinase